MTTLTQDTPSTDFELGSKSIAEIAILIALDWGKIHYAAVPFLDAMKSLSTMRDMYGAESAHTVIIYFLSNASGWRGPVAKAVKKELNLRLKGR